MEEVRLGVKSRDRALCLTSIIIALMLCTHIHTSIPTAHVEGGSCYGDCIVPYARFEMACTAPYYLFPLVLASIFTEEY
jgi:hypothetical protein